ncbi:hypothetical protein [uncultured Thiodictyon sp.]|uniref:hypothetical protein n=1 Tax=uncultured Thiodictyon sp. TaxID=1846217 RepID=UPI0025FC1EE3|nr:hypothetical protein [uncultured Thiodictyon sp.]
MPDNFSKQNNNVLKLKRFFFIFITTSIGSFAAYSETNNQQRLTKEPEFNQTETRTMSIIGSRRRRLPPELDPIVVDGVVYKELRQGNKLGYEQKGGFLVATDKKTGNILWHVRVYEVHFDAAKESDVQEVFFTQMKLLPGGTEILVENELEKRFVVNLESHSVREKR